MNYYLLLYLLVSLVLAKRYPPSYNGHGLGKGRRLIGGHQIPISRATFMACLVMTFRLDFQEHDRLLCGATIIGRIWALTAASCLDKVAKKLIYNGNVLVRSNTTIWSPPSRHDKSDHNIIDFFQHEDYDGEFNNYDNNLAVLKVNPAFSGAHEKAVDVAKPNYNYEVFSPVRLYGWGEMDDETEKMHPYLQELELNLVRPEFCHATNNEICVEALKDKDFCSGDEGGPIVQDGFAIGIMSWSPICGESSSYSYGMKLSHYYTWIFDKIRKNRRGTKNKKQW